MAPTFGRRFVTRALVGSAALAAWRPARAAPLTLVLSHHLPTNHIVHRTSERFRALVAEKTNGQVVIDIKPNSSLFNLRSGTEALRLGTTDLHWSDLGTLGNWKPEFGFISLPFIFTGFDHVKRVIYGSVGDTMKADVRSGLGIEILSFGASGFRVFLGNKVIRTAGDCKGIKLRVPEAPVWIAMARALDANPTPIPADGVYTALQTHIVDAMEAPPDFMADNKLYEIAHNATRTNHIFTEANLMTSVRKFAAWPPATQAALRESARQAVEIEMWAENLTNQERAWNEVAGRIEAVAAPDLGSFRAKTKPVVEDFTKKYPASTKYLDGVAAIA
jgi:tripartite ATP-independent transporter DctP family solute receptor